MSDGADDLVLNLWTTSGRPYVERVVPQDEIDIITGEFVWPKPSKEPRAKPVFAMTHCRECGSVFTPQAKHVSYCRPSCKAFARKRLLRIARERST